MIRLKKYLIVLLTVMIALNSHISVYASWNQTLDGVRYQLDDDTYATGVHQVDNNWYYFSEDGAMQFGWHHINDKWYYFGEDGILQASRWIVGADGTTWYYLGQDGAMLTSQWAVGTDGVTWYYLGADGAMWKGEGVVTPDGYTLHEDGSWNQEIEKATMSSGPWAFGSSSGGGSGGSSGGGSGSSGSGNSVSFGSNSSTSSDWEEDSVYLEDDVTLNDEDTKDDETETTEIIYTYTIRYQDIASSVVLKEVVATAKKDSEIEIEHAEIDGYVITDNQASSFVIDYDEKTINIYYEKIYIASDSDAVELDWEVHFVDADTHAIEIGTTRTGTMLEGSTLTINFMEKVTLDGVIWQALETTPIEIVLTGPDNLIYYVEYEKIGEVEEEEDKYAANRELLEEYLETAKEYESDITGESSSSIPDDRFYVTNQSENDARIQSLGTRLSENDEITFYMIGKDWTPNGISIIPLLGSNITYSNYREDQFNIDGVIYTVSLFSIEKTYEYEEACSHIWKKEYEEDPTCTQKGYISYVCKTCEEYMEVAVPALGHTDKDEDGICDTCGKEFNEEDTYAWYGVGDMQLRNIDGQSCVFVCIDDNYQSSNTSEKAALFISDYVFPASFDSSYTFNESNSTYEFEPGPIVSFGDNNDYKSSEIHKWLKSNAFSDALTINIGVETAYTGTTAKDDYEQLDDNSLSSTYIGSQSLTSALFSLSVEEAITYKDYLWDFEIDGLDAQITAYSKGYWLRNPMGSSSGNYSASDQVYVVDLLNGNIRPASINPDSYSDDEELNTSTIGVRPAYVLENN